MRTSPRRLSLALVGGLLAACSSEAPAPIEDGVRVAVAPLTLPSLSKVCYDLRVTNAADGAGEVVWSKGTPGLNGGTPDGDAICSTEYGNLGGGDITYIGPCDADGQEDADPDGERTNSVTVWFDGLYDEGGAYLDPASADGWQNPCVDATGAEVGCTLNTLCEENADALVEFNFTILREANQGFFDVAVNFNDIFCSAKFDCSYAKEGVCSGPGGTCTAGTLVEGKTACDTDADCVVQDPINLLHNGDGERDKTFVLGFACTAGPGTDVETELYLDNLEFDCNSDGNPAVFTTDFTLSTAGITNGNQCTAGEIGECASMSLGTETIDPNDYVYQLAIYRGEEALADAGTDEPLNKKYWNLALGVNPAIAGCKIRIAGTAEDANDPDDGVQDRAVAPGHVYPVIAWDVDAATCTQEQASAAPAGGFFANALTFVSGQVKMRYTSPTHQGFAFANALSATLPPTERCSASRPCVEGYHCTGGGECVHEVYGSRQPDCVHAVQVFASNTVPLAAGVSKTSGPPVWEPFMDGRVGVEQKGNTVPSVYPTVLDAQNRVIVFDLKVWPDQGPRDDDHIGWTVNAQGTSTTLGVAGKDFLLFNWDGMDPARTTGDAAVGRQPGLRVFRVTGRAHAGPLLKPSDNFELIAASATLRSTPWTYGRTYRVRMAYTTSRIRVWVRASTGLGPDQPQFGDEEEVLNIPGTFPEGRLGFYTASQRSARFTVVRVDENLMAPPAQCQDPGCATGAPAVITNIEEVGEQVRFHYALCGNRDPRMFSTANPSCKIGEDYAWSNAGNPDPNMLVRPRPENFDDFTSCTMSFYGPETITTPPYLKCGADGLPQWEDRNWDVGYHEDRGADDDPDAPNPYGGATYYIATDGSDANDGLSTATPWKTFAKANATVQAGDLVYVRDGEYVEDVVIGRVFGNPDANGKYYAMGTQSAPITWRSYPGETAVIIPVGTQTVGRCCPPDRVVCDPVRIAPGQCEVGKLPTGKLTCDDNADCVVMAGAAVRIAATSWNVFRDFEIRPESPRASWRAWHHMGGLSLSKGSSYNVVSNIRTHSHNGNGIASENAFSNRYIHITSEDNHDALTFGQNADGFASSSGGDNEYLHCLARNNSDDGFDFWESTGNTARYSVAAANGYDRDGNGAGFKLGGSGAEGPPGGGGNTVEYSLAYDNTLSGFDSNTGDNNLPNTVRHNTAYNNGTATTPHSLDGTGYNPETGQPLNQSAHPQGLNFRMHKLAHVLRNNLEYPASPLLLRNPADPLNPADSEYNSWDLGLSLTEADFQSLSPNDLQTTFMRLTRDSPAVDAGWKIDGLPYSGGDPDLGAFERPESMCSPRATTVWLVGDSTVARGSGWGDALDARFAISAATVRNRAIGGFSSKSFSKSTDWPVWWRPADTSVTDTPWEVVKEYIRPGEYVLIQFGHNDEKIEDRSRYTTTGNAPLYEGTYRDYLEDYITETRARGATPILVTPVSRMAWNGGSHQRTHGEYPAAMRRVALDNDVVLLDLEARSHEVFQELGESQTLSLYADDPESPDRTHFPADKAWRVAEMVADLLRASASPLGAYTP